MEQRLLDAVLAGQVELSAALAWALGDGSRSPPIELRAGSPWSGHSGPRPAPRPADFTVAVLNHVREQAELVLAAAEQEAAGGSGGSSSQPATPQPPGRAPAGGATAPPATSARQPAVEAAQQQRAGGGGPGPGTQWLLPGGTQQQQALPQPKLQPGRLDDDNFPTLAAAAATTSGGKRQGGRGSPSRQPPRASPAKQQQGGKRRTIVPAKVASLEVNPLFNPPPQAQQAEQAQQQAQQAEQAQQQAQQAEQAQQQPQPAQRLAAQPPLPQQAPLQLVQQQQQPASTAASPVRVPAAAAAAAAPLPMSPPPIAVRLPAPGAAVAASLLLRGGGGAAAPGSPAAMGSPGGGEGSTPKRITPIRLLQPAEVQPTFLAAAPATSPRAARREMLQQPEMQQRSRPGSRLGTPLAGAAAAALGLRPAAAAAPASVDARSSGSGGVGSSSSSRSPLLWTPEEQSVCQQLSFDSLLSPVKPEAATAGSKQAASGSAAVGVAAHAGPHSAAGGGAAAAAAPTSRQQLQPLEQRLQSLGLGSDAGGFSSSSGASLAAPGSSAAVGSRQQGALDAAMRRMAAPGGSSSDGFDAPRSSTASVVHAPSAAAIPAACLPLSSSSTAAPGHAVPAPAPGAQQQQPQGDPGAEQQAQQQQLQQPKPMALCPEGRRLAELHAALLRCCTAINLSAELDLLLNLLATPASVHVDPALASLTRLWCGELAQQYACCVLQAAGGLVAGLGPHLLADLAALPLVRAAFPRLHSEMERSLQHYASTQLHTEKAYRQVRAGSGILSLHGISAFTSDGRRTRSQEEQRRISNRESCRDEWFNLMKEAAAQTHSFAARQLGRLAAGASDRLSEGGRTATTAAGKLAPAPCASWHRGDEAGLLQLMQHSATDLLRRLRPDNFGAFAELFTAAVLQAAATGETLLDEELSSLARKNVGRFHSLNQRLQAQGAAGPSRGGAARLQSNQPMTATGFGRSGSGAAGQQGRWGGAAGGTRQQHQQQLRGAGGRAGGGGPAGSGYGGGADEAAAEALRLVSEFPRPQRLYVLFLEAADSHRLNSHLVRCMSGKLRALTAGEHAGSGLSERVAAVSTLAAFLSYLTFTRAGCCSAVGTAGGAAEQDGAAAAGAAYDGSHPIDAAAALEAAMQGAEGAPLAWMVPWVLRYLWFLKWDPEVLQAPYFRRLLGRLASLHGAPELRPQAARFGLAAFCLRSVLDDFAERMGPDLMPTPCGGPSSDGAAGDTGDALSAPAGTGCPALASLAAADGLLDSRFLQLCCPALEHARQLFAAGGSNSFGAGQQQAPARRIKKIRPTAPSGAAAARVALQAQAASSAPVEASRDLLKLQLQRAFLEQYSTDEHKVKLKDVVDYVADILALNCASSAADALLAPTTDAITAQLREAAASMVVFSQQEQQAAEAGRREEPTAAAPPAQQQQHTAGLDPSARLYLEAAAEQLIATHTTDILHRAQQAAEASIRAGAVQALGALTAPELGPAVIGTAAAVAAEVASAAAGQRLRAHLPSAVRRAVTEQLQHLLAVAARGGDSRTRRPLAVPASPGGH